MTTLAIFITGLIAGAIFTLIAQRHRQKIMLAAELEDMHRLDQQRP